MKLTRPASPAELRAIMEAYGIGIQSLAEMLKVRDGAVTNWYSGRNPIPDGVFQEVDQFVLVSEQLIQSLISHLQDEANPTLLVFETTRQLWEAHPEYEPLPASWYRVIAARVRQRIPGLKITYQVEQPPAGAG